MADILLSRRYTMFNVLSKLAGLVGTVGAVVWLLAKAGLIAMPNILVGFAAASGAVVVIVGVTAILILIYG